MSVDDPALRFIEGGFQALGTMIVAPVKLRRCRMTERVSSSSEGADQEQRVQWSCVEAMLVVEGYESDSNVVRRCLIASEQLASNAVPWLYARSTALDRQELARCM